MGSRAKRARNGQPARPRMATVTPAPLETETPDYPIPDIDRVSMVFGDIKHMPRYDTIPDAYKSSNHPCARFVSHWFYVGLEPGDLERLKPKRAVDRGKALTAIRAILGSFEPKHEHKTAACAFLLDQWFTLEAKNA
jgi:hypothetical protein